MAALKIGYAKDRYLVFTINRYLSVGNGSTLLTKYIKRHYVKIAGFCLQESKLNLGLLLAGLPN